MKPDAAVANPTTISSAASAGVANSADAAARMPSTLTERIRNSSMWTSVRFFQGGLHGWCQAPLQRPSAPGKFPVAGQAGGQVHQDDDRDDADRDLLHPVRQCDRQAAEADAFF